MIFNETNTSLHVGDVKESPYELGIGGALMHCYENEVNYNAIMKSVAISEARYYNETGKSLYVTESGALASLGLKIKTFFKKIIEKIKEIAKRFMAKIGSYTMPDKDFVKKYQKDLLTRNLKDFEFKGWQFPDNLSDQLKFMTTPGDICAGIDETYDSDKLDDMKDKNRGKILDDSSSYDTADFREELTEKLYGGDSDKDVCDVTSIRKYLNIISDNKKVTSEIKKSEKETIKTIEALDKELEKNLKTATDTLVNNKDLADKAENSVKVLTNKLEVIKEYLNDVTVAFGALAKANIDKTRQAKAICVKALGYKHEAANYAMEGAYSDIFDVEIM